MDQPQTCAECPLYDKARGFALGVGDPARARYVTILETPEEKDVQTRVAPLAGRGWLETQEDCDAELERRRQAFHGLDEKHYRYGVPGAGAGGNSLRWKVWKRVGIAQSDVFIDSVLRCLPPKRKTGVPYPTGEDRKAAEFYCRQYDQFDKFRPDTVVMSLAPQAWRTEITPLPLVVEDWKKVRDFAQQGRRSIVMLGGIAANAFMRYGQNATRWRGHYAALAADWLEIYRNVFAWRKKEKHSAKPKVAKEPKVRKTRKKKGVTDEGSN